MDTTFVRDMLRPVPPASAVDAFEISAYPSSLSYRSVTAHPRSAMKPPFPGRLDARPERAATKAATVTRTSSSIRSPTHPKRETFDASTSLLPLSVALMSDTSACPPIALLSRTYHNGAHTNHFAPTSHNPSTSVFLPQLLTSSHPKPLQLLFKLSRLSSPATYFSRPLLSVPIIHLPHLSPITPTTWTPLNVVDVSNPVQIYLTPPEDEPRKP